MTHNDPWVCARARVSALQARLAAQAGHPVRLIETHISWLLLAEREAWKLKKPLRLAFLDYATAAARRLACEEELRLNRRLAPSIYLDVADVHDGPHGPTLSGDGPVVDAAVHMRRFPDGALWSEMLAHDRLAPPHIDAMAQYLAGFHAAAPRAASGGPHATPEVQRRTLQRTIDAIDAWQRGVAAPAAGWPALRTWLLRQLDELAPLRRQRLAAGRVREGHGDLHLANVLQLDGAPAAFDAIEFDPDLRWIDVLDDIAFLAMDLLAHDRPALAFRFINAYLEASGDYDGLPLLRHALSARALVRAQVGVIAEGQGGDGRGPQPSAARYLALAETLAHTADPRVAITHGLPGSGKSHVSQGLIEAAGAIRVRSDVERKRLFGLAAEASSRSVAGGIYDPATTERTYARLADAVRAAAAGGWPVIVDAAFLRRSERAEFAALASTLGVPFSIVDCRAPLALLRERLQRRQAEARDASEADVAVLERLREAAEPLDDGEQAIALIADAAQPAPAPELARRWRAA